jgi:hypothetical protein
MDCQDCGRKTSVFETRQVMDVTVRVLDCGCGSRWESVEKMSRRLSAQRLTRVPVPPPVPRLLSPVPHPSLPVPQLGGWGGSESGLSLGFSDLLSDTAVSSLNQTRVGRPDVKAYPQEFEALWGGCPKRRGNKEAAFKAWAKVKPPLRLTLEVYALRMQTDSWRRGFAQHFSTWLNERGWETPPEADEMQPRDAMPAKAQQTRAASVSWLRRSEGK